jgi:hypothetical protein
MWVIWEAPVATQNETALTNRASPQQNRAHGGGGTELGPSAARGSWLDGDAWLPAVKNHRPCAARILASHSSTPLVAGTPPQASVQFRFGMAHIQRASYSLASLSHLQLGIMDTTPTSKASASTG